MSTQTKYPDIHVQLAGKEGNAFAIIGCVRKALREADVPNDEINEFVLQAMSGDYDHLLATCMKWVDAH
jgi:hypothetical protein